MSAKVHTRVTPADLPPGAEQLDIRFFPARWPYRIGFAPSLYRALDDLIVDYDVVHIRSLYYFSQFAAFRHATRHAIPYVVSPHGALDPYLRRQGRLHKMAADILWQERMLVGATAVHIDSEEEGLTFADRAPSVRRVLIPNGFDWGKFQNLSGGDAFRERYLAGSGGPIVMNIGRVTPKKGLDILIRAFAQVVRTVPECWLVVVGPDNDGLQPKLAALAAREGVGDRVVFTGLISDEEKRAALTAADVWALSSHTENFGVAVVEAMAAGLPVVISPGINIAADIATANGGIVSALTPEAFATEIVALLQDDARRTSLGQTGRDFAKRYDWSIVARQFEQLYAEVIDAHRASCKSAPRRTPPP